MRKVLSRHFQLAVGLQKKLESVLLQWVLLAEALVLQELYLRVPNPLNLRVAWNLPDPLGVPCGQL